MSAASTDEFIRVSQMPSGLTVSAPIMMMMRQQLERITSEAFDLPAAESLIGN